MIGVFLHTCNRSCGFNSVELQLKCGFEQVDPFAVEHEPNPGNADKNKNKNDNGHARSDSPGCLFTGDICGLHGFSPLRLRIISIEQGRCYSNHHFDRLFPFSSCRIKSASSFKRRYCVSKSLYHVYQLKNAINPVRALTQIYNLICSS